MSQQQAPSDCPVVQDAVQQPALSAVAMEGAGFVPTSQPFTRDGQPVRRFLKDMIAAGVYRHPVQGWTLEVTAERMDRWVASFQQMRSNGVDVAVVVDHRMDAEATLGYVVDMFRWGEKLYGVHELVGQEAIALASRIKNVSVLIEKDFVDGKQRRYGEAITHSSLVQRPLVPQQEGFLPIAASAGEPLVPALPLQAGSRVAEGQAQAAPGQDVPKAPAVDDQALQGLREALALSSEQTADGVLAAAVQHIQSLRGENERLQAELSAMSARREAYAEGAGPDRAASCGQDTELLEALAETAEDRIEALVQRGQLTAAVAAGLKDLLLGKAGVRNAYALSRGAGGESLARGVIRLLEQNQPVPLGERTGGQYVALCRLTPGQEGPAHSPQTTREMIEMASGPACPAGRSRRSAS